MTTYVLLMRHGDHESTGTSEPGQPQRRLSEKGEWKLREVAERLLSVIRDCESSESLALSIGGFWTAGSDEAKDTARVVATTLKGFLQEEPEILNDLNPETFQPYANTGRHTALADKIEARLNSKVNRNAILIIGHQPLLGWIAHAFTGKAIPLARSELACFAFGNRKAGKRPRGRLRWVISPTDDASTEEIKVKIRSKMDTAKLLSVVITTALGFLLGSLVDDSKLKTLSGQVWALELSTILFFAAIGLYLATMYAYDRLLMPSKFWSEPPPPRDLNERPRWLVWRPPTSATWVLYQNMMRIWRYLFTSATFAVLLGLYFLAIAVFRMQDALFMTLFAGVGVLAFVLFYRAFGPRLGSQD